MFAPPESSEVHIYLPSLSLLALIQCLFGFLTPPGTKILRILPPEDGTTRGSGEATPGFKSDS